MRTHEESGIGAKGAATIKHRWEGLVPTGSAYLTLTLLGVSIRADVVN